MPDQLAAAGFILAALALAVPYYTWQIRLIRNERKDSNQ